MKLLRWSLLGVALAFLIVPMGSVAVYAEDREIATDPVVVPVMERPKESSNAQRLRTDTFTTHPPLIFEQQPIGGGISYLPPAVILGLILAGVAAAGAALYIYLFVRAQIDKNKSPFLEGYTEDQARGFARAITSYIKEKEAECDANDLHVHRTLWGYTVQVVVFDYYLELDNNTGDMICQCDTQGITLVAWAVNVHDWVKATYM